MLPSLQQLSEARGQSAAARWQLLSLVSSVTDFACFFCLLEPACGVLPLPLPCTAPATQGHTASKTQMTRFQQTVHGKGDRSSVAAAQGTGPIAARSACESHCLDHVDTAQRAKHPAKFINCTSCSLCTSPIRLSPQRSIDASQ